MEHAEEPHTPYRRSGPPPVESVFTSLNGRGKGFVCAFRGRRDSYQVPVALAEAGQLDLFITDYFAGPAQRTLARALPRGISARVLSRSDVRLPPGRVQCLSGIAGAEALSRMSGAPRSRIFSKFDPMYGVEAARQAKLYKSNLFMYSPHAFEAFAADYDHFPRRILFQFHPHFALENAILAEDLRASQNQGVHFEGRWEGGAAEVNEARVRGDSAWQMADHVVCASSFTKRSLVEAGADPARITVIPYGVESETISAPPPTFPDFDRFHVLFVGSGLQRKGLHHLVLAWGRARLPSGSRMTVICRVADPALRSLLNGTAGVDVIAGVSEHELDQLYSTATLFAMPSLVEGFGQVYIEALSHGLPVLGTVNTCLHDIGNEDDGIFVAEPGNIDSISCQLENLASKLDRNFGIRRCAQTCAARFTWDRFRQNIRAVIHE